jgi:hypothetical protein
MGSESLQWNSEQFMDRKQKNCDASLDCYTANTCMYIG